MSRIRGNIPRGPGQGARLSILLVVALVLGLVAPTASASAAAPARVPDAPQRVHAQAEPASAAVSWLVPADGGSSITGYIVTTYVRSTVVATNLVHTWSCDLSADTPSCTVHIEKLDPGTVYTFTVRALNDVGESDSSSSSNPVTWMQDVLVPKKPTLSQVSAGPGSATVSWTQPYDGGSPISAYEVTAYAGETQHIVRWTQVKSDQTSTTLTGLDNSRAVRLTVRAANALGWSDESDRSTPVTPQDIVPPAPTGVQAVGDSSGITVFWTAPDNRGSMILNYTLTAYVGWTGQIAASVIALRAGSVRIAYSQLARATTYTFTVAARNAAGLGPESARTNPVLIPSMVPAPPTNVRAVVSAGTTFVSWNAPDSGGSPITGYTVIGYQGLSGQVVLTRQVFGDTTQVALVGVDRPLLGPGSYSFIVIAQNSIGFSAESARSNVVTIATVPTAPLNVQASTAAGTALVTWSAPVSNGGAPLTAYVVSAYRAGFGLEARQTLSPSAYGTAFTGLSIGSMYTFTAAAVNDVGQGPESAPSNSISLATRPAPPRNLSITPGASSAILTWDPPASDGGQPVTQYEVTVTDGQSTVIAQTVSSTTLRLTGLSASSLYTASVVAVNAVGRSDAQSASFRPLNLPPTLTLPDTQTVQYGHALTFTASATDPDPADHLTLSATGLPAGLTFTDRGDGTGTVSGTVAAQADTYLVTISASDGHNAAVTGSVRIVVLQDVATVTLAASNPPAVRLGVRATASGAITLRATVQSGDGAGQIANAAPVTYILTGQYRGTRYTRVATLAAGRAPGSVQATAQLKGLPIDAYRVEVSVGGYFFKGAADGFLSVTRAESRTIQARGTVARNGQPGSLSLTARSLASGRISGQVAYTQQVETGSISLRSGSFDAAIVAGSRVYLQGTATTNDGTRVRFLLTLVRGGTGKAGLQVIDAAGASVPGLSFDPLPLASSRISIK